MVEIKATGEKRSEERSRERKRERESKGSREREAVGISVKLKKTKRAKGGSERENEARREREETSHVSRHRQVIYAHECGVGTIINRRAAWAPIAPELLFTLLHSTAWAVSRGPVQI